MDNYKKQILQRVIDFYIEKSDADKKTIRTVACLINDIEAINYTRCCKSDSELLVWLQKSDLVTFPKDEINEVIDDYRFYQTNCG